MSRIIAALAALALTGCSVSVADVRAKGRPFSGTTPKQVDEVAGCATEALRTAGGVMVTSTPIKGGVSLTQSVEGTVGHQVFTTVDIARADGETTVTMFSRDSKSTQVKVAACL